MDERHSKQALTGLILPILLILQSCQYERPNG